MMVVVICSVAVDGVTYGGVPMVAAEDGRSYTITIE